jgi:hypothetical protein
MSVPILIRGFTEGTRRDCSADMYGFPWRPEGYRRCSAKRCFEER